MDDLRKATLKYYRVSDLQPRIAHGVYGGCTDNESVEMDFFSEGEEYSGETEYEVDEFGNLQPVEGAPEQEPTIVRTVHTRICMNRETARAFVSWLSDVLEHMDTMNNPHRDDEDLLDGVDESLIFSRTKQ